MKKVAKVNYDLLIAPLITEKATVLKEQGKYAFKVKPEACKDSIKATVEEVFGVKVVNVNTVSLHGKVKRFRGGKKGTRSDYKKAIVTLEQGKTIDTAGL